MSALGRVEGPEAMLGREEEEEEIGDLVENESLQDLGGVLSK